MSSLALNCITHATAMFFVEVNPTQLHFLSISFVVRGKLVSIADSLLNRTSIILN